MSLTHDRRRVHSNPLAGVLPGLPEPWEPTGEDDFELSPSESDRAWWAENAPATPASDLEWVESEAAELPHRPDDTGTGALALAGSVACDLAHSLRFQRVESARAYCLLKHTVPSARDLDHVALPDAWPKSPLALALVDLAGWYLLDDTDRGNFLAMGLLETAREAERFGSTTAEEYTIDLAAWTAAAIDAVCEGRVG